MLRLRARGIKLALVLSGRTETAARLADIFQHDRFFPDIDRAIEWAEDELLRKAGDRDVGRNSRSIGCRCCATSRPIRSIGCAGSLEPVVWPAGHVVFRRGD